MSKIGKQPIEIPKDVTVNLSDSIFAIKGPLGEIKLPTLKGVKTSIDDNSITLSLTEDKKQARSNWGTLRSLVSNAIVGVTKGFEKTLILEGVGYKISKEGEDLNMAVGFSHPVQFKAKEGISLEVEKNSILKIKGIDKALVGQVAAEIRSVKKPEPYKGKGFRYEDEVIRRKAGKKAITASE